MPVVSAWVAIASQWRTATVGDGRLYWVGLDYVGAKAGLDLAGIVLDPREWAELRLMERAAGNQLNAALS